MHYGYYHPESGRQVVRGYNRGLPYPQMVMGADAPTAKDTLDRVTKSGVAGAALLGLSLVGLYLSAWAIGKGYRMGSR